MIGIHALITELLFAESAGIIGVSEFHVASKDVFK
jgi:hypothetical protein